MALKLLSTNTSFNVSSIGVALSLLCVGVLLPSETLAQGFFGPKNYEDCVLANMKDVRNDSAAGLIERTCRLKFPFEPEIGSVCKLKWDGFEFSKGEYNSGTSYAVELPYPLNPYRIYIFFRGDVSREKDRAVFLREASDSALKASDRILKICKSP